MYEIKEPVMLLDLMARGLTTSELAPLIDEGRLQMYFVKSRVTLGDGKLVVQAKQKQPEGDTDTFLTLNFRNIAFLSDDVQAVFGKNETSQHPNIEKKSDEISYHQEPINQKPAWSFWLSKPYWTAEQAIALCNGDDPNNKIGMVADFRFVDSFWLAIRDKSLPALETDKKSRFPLGDGLLNQEKVHVLKPKDVARWLAGTTFPFPEEMEPLLEPDQDFSDAFNDNRIEELKENIRVGENEIAQTGHTYLERKDIQQGLEDDKAALRQLLIEEHERGVSYWQNVLSNHNTLDAHTQSNAHHQLAFHRGKLNKLRLESTSDVTSVEQPASESEQETTPAVNWTDVSITFPNADYLELSINGASRNLSDNDADMAGKGDRPSAAWTFLQCFAARGGWLDKDSLPEGNDPIKAISILRKKLGNLVPHADGNPIIYEPKYRAYRTVFKCLHRGSIFNELDTENESTHMQIQREIFDDK